MIVAACDSARSMNARRSAPSPSMSASISSRSQSLRSVATWSLRERPVCSRLPASPTSAVSRFSMLKWTSSRSLDQGNSPRSISARIVCMPALDRREIVGAQHARGGQHARVRERALDVDGGEAAVEIHRRRVALDESATRARRTGRTSLSGAGAGVAASEAAAWGRPCRSDRFTARRRQGRRRRRDGRRPKPEIHRRARFSLPRRRGLPTIAANTPRRRTSTATCSRHDACMPVSLCSRL